MASLSACDEPTSVDTAAARDPAGLLAAGTSLVPMSVLPASAHFKDPAPPSPIWVELDLYELRVSGQRVRKLRQGRFDSDGPRSHGLSELRERLPKPDPSRQLAIAVQNSVNWNALARVLYTLHAAGHHRVYLRVRAAAGTRAGVQAETGERARDGWFMLDGIRFVKPGVWLRSFEDDELLPWESFARSWVELHALCARGPGNDCGIPPTSYLPGGKVNIELVPTDVGAALSFVQEGVATPRYKGKVESRRVGPLSVTLPPPGEPGYAAVFRADRFTRHAILRRVCAGQRCPVTLSYASRLPAGVVIALLGATFPDVALPPRLAFGLPSTR